MNADADHPQVDPVDGVARANSGASSLVLQFGVPPLRQELGEAAVKRALRKFLQTNAYLQSPCTKRLELLDFIRAEARLDQQGLITDLSEKISFHDNRVEEATAKKRADGKYEVTLKMHAARRMPTARARKPRASSTTGSTWACSRAESLPRSATSGCCTFSGIA